MISDAARGGEAPSRLKAGMGSAVLLVGLVLLVNVPAYLLVDRDWYYRSLAGHLEFGYNHPIVLGLSVLLLAMVWGRLGTALGIQNLFWDDDPRARAAASCAVTLYFAMFGTLAYYEQTILVWHGGPGVVVPKERAEAAAAAPPASVGDRHEGRRVFLPRARNLEKYLLITGLPVLVLILAPALMPPLFPGLPRRPARAGVGPAAAWLADLLPSLLGVLIALGLVVLSIRASALGSPSLLAAIIDPGNEHARLRVELRAIAKFTAVFLFFYAGLCSLAYRWVTPAVAVCAILSLVVLTLTMPTFLIRLIDADGHAFRRICQVALAAVAIVVPWLIATTEARARSRAAVAPGKAGVAGQTGTLVVAALGGGWVGFELLERSGAWLPEHRQTIWFLIFWGGLGAWLVLANGDAYKLRFPNMAMYYPGGAPGPVRLREAVEGIYRPIAVRPEGGGDVPGGGVRLLEDAEVLPRWLARVGPGPKPKLAVVTVSGGALRSAYWTRVVLGRIEEEIPDFGAHLRVIAGASGGMLGAAYYVCDRRAKLTPGGPAIPPMPVASIAAVARHIALREMWFGFLPRRALDACRSALGVEAVDRGVILERDWEGIDVPFRGLMGAEAAGEVPSLIFSPMIVEDGRRLLISNLDLKGITRTSGTEITEDGLRGVPETYSLTALEFFRLFPEAEEFRLATMVRMSASFPFVSPAVSLPTVPPRRIVDAGYYDNYGVQIATSWIHANLDWLAEHTSGVTLIQIRDELSREDRLEVVDAPMGLGARLARGVQFLTSPVHAVAKARAASNAFRNDEDVEVLSDLFAARLAGTLAQPESFFASVTFENSAKVVNRPGTAEDWPGDDRGGLHAGGSVALNWYLSRAERQGLESAIPRPGPGSPWADGAARRERIRQLQDDADRSSGLERLVVFKELERALNYERLQQLKRWWVETPAPAGASAPGSA